MHVSGVPGVLGALSLAYVSNLFGSMTHYGSGQVWSIALHNCSLLYLLNFARSSSSRCMHDVAIMVPGRSHNIFRKCLHACRGALPVLIIRQGLFGRMLLQVLWVVHVQAAVYYGAGYLDLKEVFSIGGIMVVINALIWGVAGSIWWKICGFY